MPANFITGLGQQAASSATGGALGLALGGLQNQQDYNQQKRLQKLQMQGQQEMALFNYQQQMKMWEETNYKAQIEQLKKAGLNPGLIYGMGGAGGTTQAAQAQGPGSGGVQGNAITGMGLMMGQTAAQTALLQSQKKNIDADTAKKQAEVPNIQASTLDLLQGVENKEAQETLTYVQTRAQQLELDIREMTKDAAVSKIKSDANIAFNQLNILKNDSLISENTWSTKIDMVAAEYAGLLIKNDLMKKQIEVDNAKISQIIQDMQSQLKQLQQTDKSLSQKDQDIIIDKARNKLIETGIWVGAASGLAGDALKMLMTKKPGGK